MYNLAVVMEIGVWRKQFQANSSELALPQQQHGGSQLGREPNVDRDTEDGAHRDIKLHNESSCPPLMENERNE